MEKDLVEKIPCCPELVKDDNCDEIYFTRTLNYPIRYKDKYTFIAQLILSFRLKRCTKGLVLGDPVYTTTLLPGEKVRLFSTDRRSKFTFDKETQMSYRHEQMSEENYFMTATQDYFSKYENQQSGTATTSEKGKWNFKGDAEGGIDFLGFGASASSSASTSYDNSSLLDYLYTQSSNMQSSASQAINTTQTASSMSIGEVSTRSHSEGSTEDHFESSSREFKNDNTSHAVTYIFYRLNKKQTIHFELVKIERIISLSTGSQFAAMVAPYDLIVNKSRSLNKPNLSSAKDEQMTTNELRIELDNKLKSELIESRIIDEKGNISEVIKEHLEFYQEFSLPTAGIIVKGCLDECNTLEPERARYYKLKNDLLEKQIELLEKSQEYRCCPPSPVFDTD
ncbi:MAG: hypothetical protein A2X64_05160 [Ignavibacteria bacterium GWF2_33_9]|nr:MAG: hypothetical protein A2X64_05160 [Ignavibacteria bacterium GWF2_33_9]